MIQENERPPIHYSCHFKRSRDGEQFARDHTLGLLVSGTWEVSDVNTSYVFRDGDLYLCRRNRLVKYAKQPPENGEYRSVSMFFDQDTLRHFSVEHGYSSSGTVDTPSLLALPSPSLLSFYMQSLMAYEAVLQQPGSRALLAVKQEEALLLLLQLKPELKDILFDFSEPGKIDLEAFMNRNFHFNVDLSRFAYLTGRSLSTFKRDFDKIFGTTPSRWLLQRRLQEAYYLLHEKRRQASDIYLDLGFEDLSHFSYAFKKQYGVAPSMI